MSDQSSPPKPKPGSLRDRIAAFEHKGAPGAPAVPPPPRPKPGGLQWKPKPPSPPPTSPDHVQTADRKPTSTAGMSASDAMESIGRAGSLKERMAALQGKGAFGGPPPPIAPKPNVDRPKWKPPPAVPASATSDDEPKEDTTGRASSRSSPPRAMSSPPPPENQGASRSDADAVPHEGGGGDPDPEEEERQRRAAIAARMARLGGARFGMAPPIFAPKPVVRKPEAAPEVKDEDYGDQLANVKESSEALVTSTSPPDDLPAAIPSIPEVVTETEHKDEPESPPPVPPRAPTAMPVPAGPRRAAPPRKKASKNAPTTALPEPPVEEEDGIVIHAPHITEPPASADRTIHDVRDSQKEIDQVMEVVGATHDEHLNITSEAKQRTPAPVEAFRKPVQEPEEQEAEEELVEGAASHVEEQSTHTAADDQEAPFEQPPGVVEEDKEEEETHRQRVAAKPVEMGAFNPLVAPLTPSYQSFDEPAFVPSEATLDVEGEVNEEYGVTIPPPSAVPPRQHTVQTIKHDAAEPHVAADQDDVKVDEDELVPANRDGEGAVASHAQEQGDEHTLPSPEPLEDQSIEYASVHVVTQQAQGTASTQEDRLEGDTDDINLLARGTTAETNRDTFKDEVEAEDMSSPRITRPIPPPPVNLRSKPTPPSSPPLSPPPKTPLKAPRVDEYEQCPASPDIPPRPIPPPGRSSSMMEDSPRRSIPPPPRRASVQVTGPLAETPYSPPPGPTSPRPINWRPDTPPIITTITVPQQAAPMEHEDDRVVEDENGTPRPDVPEDDALVRRRTIAERMARLGGIRFGAPPPMNPLSRPPLPAAPPPTSIPPDDMEEEGRDEEGPRGEDEDEAARKQRIAAKLAGMGGMRFGMLPPAGLPPASVRRLVSRQEDSESEDTVLPVPVPAPPQRAPPTRKPPPPIEVPVEQEPKQVGRDSRGTSDDGVKVEAEESEMEEVRYSDAEVPLASSEEEAPALPPPRRSTQTPRSPEALPTPPPRMTSRSPPPNRPPIPMIPTLLGRRKSSTTGSVSASSSRQASLDESSPGETPTLSGRASESALRRQSEYVLVEADVPDDDSLASPPRRKSTRGGPARSIPSLPPVPPPSAIDPPEALTSSAQWELPTISQGVEFGEGSEMTSSGWSEGSTAVHVPLPTLSPSSSHPGFRSVSGKVGLLSSSTVATVSISGSGGSGSGSGSGRRSLDQQLTTDELMTIWGKTGVRVVEAATALFEKSKRALVGDGSHAGFVRAVLAQVPGVVYPGAGAAPVLSPDDDWGYVVYAQTGSAVQRRVSDILPGDVIAFSDAKLKGHKGLHAYTQTAGAGERGGGPLVGIVSEFEGKKSKVRVWQANQHVGQQVSPPSLGQSLSVFRRLARVKNGVLTPRATQTVEIVSYRLEDLKSGQVKVYRVLEA